MSNRRELHRAWVGKNPKVWREEDTTFLLLWKLKTIPASEHTRCAIAQLKE